MSLVFDNFPAPLPPHQYHHHHNVNAVPRSLPMPAPASQVHNFPSLSNQQQQQQEPQSSPTQGTQTSTFAQTPQDPKKRHACSTCGRAFTTSGHLARHIRVHTGERNHKCPFPGCETRCSRQDNLQQHYRIHLSPGSRRSSSTRSRAEAKKRTSLSTSSTLPSLSPVSAPRSVLLHDEPPDSPPPLARATVLPSLHHRASYPTATMMSHERPDQIQNHHYNQGRSHSSSASASASGSGSSAGSPHSYASATASPDISPNLPPPAPVNVNGSAGNAAAYGNLLGLSHERQHSPGAGEYNPYNNSSYSTTSPSNGHVYSHHSHRQLNTADNYGLSANSSSPYSNGASQPGAPPSFAHTLPPIQSLSGTNGSSFGLGRISQQHPGPYPSYETSYTTSSNSHTPSTWSSPDGPYSHHAPQHHHQPHHHTWWSQNGVNVGVSVGAGTLRGYQSYGTS